MFDSSVIYGLLLISTALAASLDARRYDIQHRATVPDDTQAFVQSLNLPSSQAQDLMVLAKNGPPVSKRVRLACLAARYSLGSASVESQPGNNLALEDANWSVVPAVLKSGMFMTVIQVGSLLESPIMHHNSSIDPGSGKGPQAGQVLPNEVLCPQWRPLPESWLV